MIVGRRERSGGHGGERMSKSRWTRSQQRRKRRERKKKTTAKRKKRIRRRTMRIMEMGESKSTITIATLNFPPLMMRLSCEES